MQFTSQNRFPKLGIPGEVSQKASTCVRLWNQNMLPMFKTEWLKGKFTQKSKFSI